VLDDLAILELEEIGQGASRIVRVPELTADEAGLIVVGEPTLEKGFDRAVTHAAKIVKHSLDASTDELANELEGALKSS
jgi:hypothetical protein